MFKQKPDSAAIGKLGEHLAANHLTANGYEIIHQNWRYKRAEIDIIAKKDGLLIFIEVKTKTSVAFGHPEEAVDEQKANKVMEGAEQFIDQINWNHDIRFDIIAIQLTEGGHKLLHFKDAFY